MYDPSYLSLHTTGMTNKSICMTHHTSHCILPAQRNLSKSFHIYICVCVCRKPVSFKCHYSFFSQMNNWRFLCPILNMQTLEDEVSQASILIRLWMKSNTQFTNRSKYLASYTRKQKDQKTQNLHNAMKLMTIYLENTTTRIYNSKGNSILQILTTNT